MRRAAQNRLSALLLLALACAGPGGPRAASEPYTPGLGEIMSFTQMRHTKLWYAGEARNWPLASYEVDELEEGFADVVRFHPALEDSPRPLAELVPGLTAGPIAALRAAIARRSPAEFAAAYDGLTEACNACHAAAKHSFNVVVRPTSNPYSNQDFGAGR